MSGRSSEPALPDRVRTSSGSASVDVDLTRRLTHQVYVGTMEVPPEAVDIDKPAPGEMALSEMNAAFAACLSLVCPPSRTHRTAASTRCSTAVCSGLRTAMRNKVGRL
ncbi:hypothetical protein PR003_g6589 [Phytophthora rubi]|uniref:Uncharacterized protein n=1 Tax=Phytophthora rubi TaxID=129364 RepID=A0A6A4G0G5_9STRA|nr:hypothetical protein PR002_g17240 [Phytophthora rubi]KAE9042284.1 hypothetical protein PR001_g6269 [Phytophthora rubi]KAE9348123.1 hypothetical protein PR003_g6589 [Phytophthora rubi]